MPGRLQSINLCTNTKFPSSVCHDSIKSVQRLAMAHPTSLAVLVVAVAPAGRVAAASRAGGVGGDVVAVATAVGVGGGHVPSLVAAAVSVLSGRRPVRGSSSGAGCDG